MVLLTLKTFCTLSSDGGTGFARSTIVGTPPLMLWKKMPQRQIDLGIVGALADTSQREGRIARHGNRHFVDRPGSSVITPRANSCHWRNRAIEIT